MRVRVVSLGLKRAADAQAAMPMDPSVVLVYEDVRHLPNPHGVKLLKPLDGRHRAVCRWLERHASYKRACGALAGRALRASASSGRKVREVVVVVACYGGRHRSVAVAEEVASRIDGADVEHLELGLTKPEA